MTKADWIAVDWGTSRLRAFAMSGANVIQAASSDKGMGGLEAKDFEPALLELVEPWLDAGTKTPVIACGMVGAKEGWADAGYNSVPCYPLNQNLLAARTSDPRIDVAIIAGLSQTSPPDVMRGEETQIVGYLRTNPDFDGVICLPGTHTKWVRISAGEVVSFMTFMTGELFSLLANNSVLRHTVSSDSIDQSDFLEAVSDAISKPQFIAARLFSLRAEALLDNLAPVRAKARLSGSLIGVELAAARPYWLGQQITIIGAPEISAHYGAALTAQGVEPSTVNADEMTVAGLTAAYEMQRGKS